MGLLDEARGVQAPPDAQPGAPAQPSPEGQGLDLASLHRDPQFQRLSPAEQQRVLGALGAPPSTAPALLGGLQAENPAVSHPGVPPDMPIDSAVPRELKSALIDPAYRLLTGRSQGVLGTTGDVIGTGQLIGAGMALATTGPAGAASVLLAPTVGAAARGLLTDFNVSQGWSQFLGGLAEIGVGGAQALSGWRSAMSTARGVVGEATAGGAVGEGAAAVTKSQQLGSAIISRANNAFSIRGKPISTAIDGLESTASKMVVDRGNPVFSEVQNLVDKAKEFRVTAPELTKLETDLGKGQVNIKDVVSLRKELEGNLSYAKAAADPNTPASRKLAQAVRGYATNTIIEALGPQAGAKYGESLLAWKTQVKDPQRILNAVLSKNLEPSTAFELTFGKNTAPEVVQTLAQLKDVDPTLRATLRLGAMQHLLAAAGGNLSQSENAFHAFKTLGPMLGTTGLFSGEELASLKLFMRPGMIQEAMGTLGSTVSGRTSRLVAFGLAAATAEHSGSAIYHLVAQHPQLGFLAVAASGTLPLLRRVMLAPPGSPTAQAAAAGIARGMVNLGSQLASKPSAQTED